MTKHIIKTEIKSEEEIEMDNKDLKLAIILALGTLCMGFASGYFIAQNDMEMKVFTAYWDGVENGTGTVAFHPPETTDSVRVFGSISGECDGVWYHVIKDNTTDDSTTLKPLRIEPYHNLTVTVLVVQSKENPQRKGLYVYARPTEEV